MSEQPSSSIFDTTLHSEQHHLAQTAHCVPKISSTDDYYSCPQSQYLSMAMARSNSVASSVIVKKEADDAFHVATDSEGDTEELEGEDISLDELQEFDHKFTTNPNMKFPLGCKVWYNARTSRVSTNSLRAKSASVLGIYIHYDYERLRIVYKLKDTASQCDTFVYEDGLVYGMNCPVTITDASTNDIHDGVIVCPKLHQSDDGKQQVSSYDVQILQGSDTTVEFGIAADRIRYRFEKPTNNNTSVEKKIKSEREESSIVKEIEAKEKNEEDPNPNELPNCRSKRKDDTESALKLSVTNTSTDQSAETTSGAVTKASLKPTDNIHAESKIKGERDDKNGAKEVEAKEKNKEEPKGLPKCPSTPTKSNNDTVSALKPVAKQLKVSESDIPAAKSAETTSGAISAGKKAGAGKIDIDKYANLADMEKFQNQNNRQRTIMNEPLTSTRWKPPSKRSAESTTIQRPNKKIKADGDGSCMRHGDVKKCTLVIPSWMPQEKEVQRQKSNNLMGHLIGVDGRKLKWIYSRTGCKIHITPRTRQQGKAKNIEFSFNASANIEQAIVLVEDSLKEYLSDKNAEKRLSYELAQSAFGSYKPQHEQTPHGVLVKRFTGEKTWWCILELPHNFKGQYDVAKKLPENCKINVFSNTKYKSPYVLVSGDALADAKVAVSMVAEWIHRI